MIQENQVSLKEFNMLADNLASVWIALDMKGYYSPHLSSLVMTSENLLEVMGGKIFRIEKKDIQICTLLQKSSKADLYIKLKELIQKIAKGSRIRSREFTRQRMANLSAIRFKSDGLSVYEALDRRCWASDKGGFRVIFMLSRLLKQLDTTLFRSKKPGFLKRTEEQRITKSEKKSEYKLQRLKRWIKRFELMLSTQLAN